MGKKNWLALLLFAIVVAVVPRILGDSYYISVLVFVGIYSIVTIGLSLLMGYAGQISLGHAAFFGIGAYTSGLLTTRCALSGWVALPAAIALAGLLAFLMGGPTLRLTGHYLAMATLAFGVIVYIFFEAAVDLTGGPSGFGSIPRLSIGGWRIRTDLHYYYLVWGVTLLVMILGLNTVHSRVGRALRSIHGSETAARAMGVNTARHKTRVFILSACLAALAGGFYAHYVTFISPSTFDFKFSVTLVTMVAVGGMSSLWGALAGTVLLAILPEHLRAFDNYYLLIYGGILIVIMMYVPQGFLVGLGELVERLFTGIFSRQSRTPV